MKKLVILLLAISVLICLASCEYFISQTEQTTEPPEHEHTFEYVQHEETHFKQYTCGCTSPDIAEEHYDNDGDKICDVCAYTIPCPYQWVVRSIGHKKQLLCDCCTDVKYIEEPHVNNDGDIYCDVCKYMMNLDDHEQHTFIWVGHFDMHYRKFNCGCDIVDSYGCHIDDDNDNLCDVCEYNLTYLKLEGTYYLPYNTIYDPVSITFSKNGKVVIKFTEESGHTPYIQNYWIENNQVYMDIDTAPKVHVFTIYENALVFDPALSTANLWDSMYYHQGAVVYFLPGVSESEKLATITMAKQKLDHIPNIEKIYGKYEYQKNHGKHGILENDVYAFMIEGDGKGEVWSDKILGTDYTFTYKDSREILIYCQGMLVSLNQALYRGFITPEILGYLNLSHRECEIAHSYDEGVITKNSDGVEEILYTCFVCQNTKTVALPEDFSFTLTYGFDLYYNSTTGYLRNGYNYDLHSRCETTLILDHDELMNIYRMLYNGKMFDIKEDFEATKQLVIPSYEIEISYTINGETVEFTVWGASYTSYSEWQVNSAFCYEYERVVKEFIISSEEYKSLPPNQNVYY